MQIANRMANIPFSGIRKVLEAANRMEQDGRKIIRLEIGRPDFDTPAHIKAAAAAALTEGKVHYTSNYGIAELRNALARKLAQENGITCDPASEVIVTAGATEAVFVTVMGLLNPGDEVLIPGPCWPSYLPCCHMAGAVPVSVPARFENRFVPRIEDVTACLTARTRMIIVNSPNNPTGSVYGADILKNIAQVAIDNDLFVLSDEIYERIIYDGIEHQSIGSYPDMRERTITVNGFSKAFSMTGWRLGYVAADESITAALIRIHQNTMACATTFAQWGGLAAITGSQTETEKMISEFDRRRNFMFAAMENLPGVRTVKPEGAFYLFVDIDELGRSAEEVAMFLLEQAGVAVVPGPAFGTHGKSCIRISYAAAYETLEIAAQKMADAFAAM